MIFQKGILQDDMKHIKVIGLNEKIQKLILLPIKTISKLMYQLTQTLITIYEEQNSIEKLTLNDLFINESEDDQKLDIYIKSSLVKKEKSNNLEFILNTLKNILIKIGFNLTDVKKFKSFEEILIYILELLQIDLNSFGWRQKILENIYGLKIISHKEYNYNKTIIFYIETPYYIETQDEVLIKWIHEDDQQKKFNEIIQYKKLQNSNLQYRSNSAQLYCYNLGIQNSALMFLKKYCLTLKEYCALSDDLSVQDKRNICCALASELQNLHDKNKIHRDLKPDNIMVTFQKRSNYFGCEITKENFKLLSELQWSIIDFESNIEKGQNDDFKGTPQYRPPEDMKEKPFDESYDIWQMGMCFLFLMTQEQPNLKKQNTKEKYDNYLKEKLSKLKDQNNKKNLSDSMYDVISQMTTYEPDKRLPIKEVIKKLKTTAGF